MRKFRTIEGGRGPEGSPTDKDRDHLRLIELGPGMTAPSANRRTFYRSETFEQTISGLLTKRADLLGEAVHLRDRLAEIKNDISALDRVLVALGYQGDLDAQMPRQKRQVIFGTGELTRGIVDALRDAPRAMTSREIASTILEVSGSDARDRKLMTDHTKRVSKAARSLAEAGRLTRARDDLRRVVWKIATVHDMIAKELHVERN